MIDSDMKKITNLLYMLAVLLLASCNDFLDKILFREDSEQ